MNAKLFRALATLALLRPSLDKKEKSLLKWALEDDKRINAAIKDFKKQKGSGPQFAASSDAGKLAAINPANILEALKAFLELLPQILAILDLLKKQKPSA